ncbi:MAG: peptidoglycan editing factor PgeF [Erythrobacter sp.]|uniref:peptidoglycan editing factor PgeF n=1 Tax=Erythrobacter sp. TaxID=1042 RepID=UPI0032664F9B
MAEHTFSIERAAILEGVPHGFFGSCSGVHQFGFGGPGDAEDIRALRNAAAGAILPGAPLQTPQQVHSPEVITLSQPPSKKWPDHATDRPVADALVTDRTDVVIGIVTADCGPVLFADRGAGVVGAAHAGWRGAHGGVLESTLKAMEGLGAERANIVAVLGPMIAQSSYEVDAEFCAEFGPADALHFKAAGVREGAERWQFDLPGYILKCLRQSGLTTISVLGRDTHHESDSYYSYRRAVQNGAPDYGRQLSAIAVG